MPWALADEKLEHQLHRRRLMQGWCTIFQTRPDYSEVIIVIRGVDGASIDPGSWTFLHARFPRLKITLAFSCVENFVCGRLPAGQDFFSRTDPHDTRLYGVFPPSKLAPHLLGTTVDVKSTWLTTERRLGRLYRKAIGRRSFAILYAAYTGTKCTSSSRHLISLRVRVSTMYFLV